MLSTLISIAADNNITISYSWVEPCQATFHPYTISLNEGEIASLAEELDVPRKDVKAVILAHELGHCLAMLDGANGFDEWVAWDYAARIHPPTLLFSGLKDYALNTYVEEYGSKEIAQYSFAMDYELDQV